jgi:hypothetical protein
MVSETDWLSCADPQKMLSLLRNHGATERKLRLFAVACCRGVLDALELFPAARWFVEVNEQVADGHISAADAWSAANPAHSELAVRRWLDANSLVSAGDMIHALWPQLRSDDVLRGAEEVAGYDAVYALLAESARERSFRWWRRGPKVSDAAATAAWEAAVAAKRSELVALVRCIFGTPFRQPTFDPSWRTETAVALATQMYDMRDFSLMPILGDALQDAGCPDGDVLEHCRGANLHVRGCFVVDLVLGRS